MTRGRVRALFAWGLVAGLASLAWIYVVPFPAVLLSEHNITSTRILDRHGRGLREVFGAAGGRARWTKLEGVSPWLPLALIHAEDRRFYSHTGVDPIAMVRSMVYNARLGRVVTGASTITQQTVKVVMHRGERRGVALKIEEMAWALRLERAADKDMILEQYVNRLPFGNLLFGVGAASRMYLGKAPDRLTLAEAVLLAQIPSSPSRNNPYADMERARQRARALLGVMLERGAISSSQYERALDEALTIKPRRGRVIAAHFTEHVHGTLEESSAPREVHTTLELELQRAVHGIVRQHVTMLQDQHVEQAAALVVHNPTGEVLAWVGSREYWDEERAGANDGVVALRQPGSVLKPFVYAMYFDEGGAPFHQVEDREVQFPTEDGAYIPKNYDRRTHGWVSLRQALGSSLNIPAVVLTERLGADHVLAKLREAGLTSLDESPEHYGLGVALGNGEVRMLEVAEAYATLASGGVRRPVSVRKDLSMGPGHRVFSEQAAYMALDVLRDDFAREIGFGRRSVLDLPFDVAMKTGTSTGYRDNWAVGVTPEYTVAAWAGNFDGSPMHHTSGIVGAAPIVRQVMQALHPGAANRGSVAWFERPPGLRDVIVCRPGARALCRQTVRDLDWEEPAGPMAGAGDVVRIDVDPSTGQRAAPGHLPRQTRWLSAVSLRELHVGGARRQAHGEERARILHPVSGDVFFRAPGPSGRTGQAIALRVDVPVARRGERVVWEVDGEEFARLEAPYEVLWPLGAVGAHRVRVRMEGSHEVMDEVRVAVEAP